MGKVGGKPKRRPKIKDVGQSEKSKGTAGKPSAGDVDDAMDRIVDEAARPSKKDHDETT